MNLKEIWDDLPLLFLIFISSFLSIKTIFIIFFNTPFDPEFILHLSPLHMIKSVTDLQLLTTSLVLTISDLYLHLKRGKFRVYSIPITLIILSGLSLSIVASDVGIEMGVEYAIFLAFLMVLSVDVKTSLITHKSMETEFEEKIKISSSHSNGFHPSVDFNRSKIPTDLVLISDIDKEHIEILRSLGIKNVDDLANVDASKLVKDFKRYMKELEDAISDLTKDKVEIWIENAKNLVNERNRFRNA